MLIDPNLAYVLLVIGLWVAATAAYIPGTGIIDGLAVLAVIGAAILLSALPTNLIGVLLLTIGVVGFAIIPFIRRRPLWLIGVGLMMQVAGSFLLYHDGIVVSPIIVIGALSVPLAYHAFLLMPIMERQFARPAGAMERDANIIGMRGRVIQILNPIGTVYVNSESWTAEGRRKLKVGMPIVVVAREGLSLIVDLDREKYAQMKAIGEAHDLDDDDDSEIPAVDQRGA
jgi:membrane-bound serine protease (ClpP class)